MTDQQDPNAVQRNPSSSSSSSTTSKVDEEISSNGGGGGSSAGWGQKIRYPNPPDSSAGWGQKISYPNPPDATNPDTATLREQWKFTTRLFSRWYSHAWGTAILAGISLFALGWFIKGNNPLPSKKDEHQPPSPSSTDDHR